MRWREVVVEDERLRPFRAVGRLITGLHERAREGYLSEMPVHQTSCSERLRSYYVEQLKPKGVDLSLVLADIYKATWEEVPPVCPPTQHEASSPPLPSIVRAVCVTWGRPNGINT